MVLILAVGQDYVLLDTRSSVLRAAGYLVESAFTLPQAINGFEQGDYDMVLLCHSIPLQDRDRLTSAIRASGSRIPVVVVAPASQQDCSRGFADAVLESDPKSLLHGVEKVLRHMAISHQPTETASDGHLANRAGRHTVLCIDRDSDRLAIRRRLLKKAGYLVLAAQNDCEGMKIFSTGIVDAVVLDDAMPGMKGRAFAVQLRHMNKDVPLILYSGHSAVPAEDLALFTRILPSGASPETLLSALENTVRNPSLERPGVQLLRMRGGRANSGVLN